MEQESRLGWNPRVSHLRFLALHLQALQTWQLNLTLENLIRNFPGGPVVKNPPCNAGNASWIPDGGTKIPQATEQLSPRAAIRVCALLRNILHGAMKISSLQLRRDAAK